MSQASKRAERGYLLNIQNTPCTRCGWDPDEDGQGYYPSLGGTAVSWIETNLIFGAGDYVEQPFRLLPDQKLFLYRWYEFCPSQWDADRGLAPREIATGCGKWRFRKALRMEATGGGKTQFVAAVCLLEFCGPEEIAPKSPNIVLAAASYEQANLTYGQIVIMAGGMDDEYKSPLTGSLKVFDKRVEFKDGRNGKIFRIAAKAGTAEGGNPSLFVPDELHEWGDVPTGAEDETNVAKARVHAVVGKSTTKRQMHWDPANRAMGRGPGRIFNISTAGFDKKRSLLGQMYTHCKKVAKDQTLDPELLINIYEAPEGLDYTKKSDRIIACKAASPSAGVLWDVETRVNTWGTPEMPDHEWIRYYANCWVDMALQSWLRSHPMAWQKLEGTWQANDDENDFVLAVDMALNHDNASVVKVQYLGENSDGKDMYAVTAKTWDPKDYGGRVPHEEVWAYLKQNAKGLKFRGIVYDPKYFEGIAQLIALDNINVIEFSQDAAYLAPAAGLAYRYILNGQIVHDGDESLADHVKFAVAVPIERGGFTLKKNRSGEAMIDSCIAMLMGLYTLHNLEPSIEPLFAWG